MRSLLLLVSLLGLGVGWVGNRTGRSFCAVGGRSDRKQGRRLNPIRLFTKKFLYRNLWIVARKGRRRRSGRERELKNIKFKTREGRKKEERNLYSQLYAFVGGAVLLIHVMK